MKISFLIGGMGKGGAERVIATLSNYYVKRGDEVSVITLWNKVPEYRLDERVHYYCLEQVKENKTIGERSISFAKKIKSIRHLVKAVNPDILVAYNPKMALLAKLACMKRKVIGMEGTNPAIRSENKWIALSIKLSAIADGFVFQTRGARSFYPKATQKKSTIIPNPIAEGLPMETPSYGEREKCICGVGRLEKVKRFDLLIDAFAAIEKKYLDYSLHIFGEGSLREELERKIVSLDLQDRVFLEGNVNNIPEVLSNSRVFVLSSDYEGMPNALIEALASGCACISTDCNYGPADLIENDNNGVLVPTDSVVELKLALDKVLADEVRASYLAENAKAIRSRLATEVVSEDYRNYFEIIINK